jgi:hypothetical protein
MRIGLIGLGRIGAFHADTLVGIPAIESLVVTDLVPERTKHVVDRHRSDGVEGVDSLEALLASGVDGVIIGGADRRGGSRAVAPARGLHRARPDGLPAPVRRRHRRGTGRRRER